jgi:hypothetical protein
MIVALIDTYMAVTFQAATNEQPSCIRMPLIRVHSQIEIWLGKPTLASVTKNDYLFIGPPNLTVYSGCGLLESTFMHAHASPFHHFSPYCFLVLTGLELAKILALTNRDLGIEILEYVNWNGCSQTVRAPMSHTVVFPGSGMTTCSLVYRRFNSPLQQRKVRYYQSATLKSSGVIPLTLLQVSGE